MKTIWKLDPAHSEVQFKVKHLMISTVTGTIKGIDGEIEAESGVFEGAKVTFKANLSTIDTSNADRDLHLKSADFFDVENHPILTFSSQSYSEKNATIDGILQIKGVEKPIKLNVEYNGKNKDPWGNEKVGFSVSGKINRTEWGLNWNAALETGGVLVSDEVKIYAELQFAISK